MSSIGVSGGGSKGDALVRVESLEKGDSPDIRIDSPVSQLFGDRQEQAVEKALIDAAAGPVRVTVSDNHAVDWVLRARVLAAVQRMRGQT